MIKITHHCNRAYKKLSAVGSWENSHKASVEAQLKKIEVKNSVVWFFNGLFYQVTKVKN
jgi:hypothetical protein